MDKMKKSYYERQKAIAVRYEPDDVAPKILAKGVGTIAEKILAGAVIADIPIHKDPQLAESLTKVDVGAHIPPELYEVVAQVLVFISELDEKAVRRQRDA
jgi:flagellar biosynthesis protein